MRDRLDVQISAIGRAVQASPRSTYINSAVPFSHNRSGGTDHHQRNVTLSRFRAHAARRTLTANISGTSLGFHLISDDLEIQIPHSNLGLHALGDVRNGDVAF